MANIETIALDTRYFAEVAAPGTPSAGQAVVYVKTDGKLYLKDDAGTETDLTASGSGMSNPMTTSQDIIVGGASGTPGRLAVGTEGQVLTVSSGNVAWAAASGGSSLSTGTSFPGTPSTGDRYRRSDLGYRIFFFDGTRWLSEVEYPIELRFGFPPNDNTTTNNQQIDRMVIDGDLSVYVTRMTAAAYVGTNDGSNYWTIKLQSFNSADTATDIDTTINTSSGSSNSWMRASSTVGAVVDTSTAIGLTVRVAKTGSPGAIYPKVKAYYRFIAT